MIQIYRTSAPVATLASFGTTPLHSACACDPEVHKCGYFYAAAVTRRCVLCTVTGLSSSYAALVSV